MNDGFPSKTLIGIECKNTTHFDRVLEPLPMQGTLRIKGNHVGRRWLSEGVRGGGKVDCGDVR